MEEPKGSKVLGEKGDKLLENVKNIIKKMKKEKPRLFVLLLVFYFYKEVNHGPTLIQAYICVLCIYSQHSRVDMYVYMYL